MAKNIKHIASIISPYNRGEKTLLAVLSNLKQEKNVSPIPVLFNALKHLSPGLKVLPQIRAGRTIFLSASLTEKSSLYYAMRWCLNTDNVNLKTPLDKRLTTDLLDAFQKTGHAYAFKKDLNQSVINSRVNAKHVYRRNVNIKGKRGKKGKKLPKKAKFKFLRQPKKKPSLIYLTDSIPAVIKSRIRAKKLIKHKTSMHGLKQIVAKKNNKKNRALRKKLSIKKRSHINKIISNVQYTFKFAKQKYNFKLRGIKDNSNPDYKMTKQDKRINER
jgi:ribosomal protein S7